MDSDSIHLVFGPVPSRRLGRSLGVNIVPPKTCTYACVYCQLGPTTVMTIKGQRFHEPESVVEAVRARLDELAASGEAVDYVTILAEGEPTLEEGLGEILAGLSSVKTAVITNGSLLFRPAVRAALSHADWVSVKVDAVENRVWRRVNRPHRSLRLPHVLAGIKAFADEYSGTLATETMLLAGMNDDESHIRGVARFVAGLSPAVAYLAVPTRPPAVESVRGPDEAGLIKAYTTFASELTSVEYLVGSEGDAFSSTGDFEQDVLSITAVHPMREEAVDGLLERTGAEREELDRLLREGRLVRSNFGTDVFYTRRIS